MIQVTCERCGGSGHYSYNPKDGTMCYGCQGRGVVIISHNAYATRQHRQVARQVSVEQGQAKINTLRTRYASDPRMAQLANVPAAYHHLHMMEWAEQDEGR